MKTTFYLLLLCLLSFSSQAQSFISKEYVDLTNLDTVIKKQTVVILFEDRMYIRNDDFRIYCKIAKRKRFNRRLELKLESGAEVVIYYNEAKTGFKSCFLYHNDRSYYIDAEDLQNQ